MSSSSHTKYFTFFYWNKTNKLISSALQHSRFIFEPSYSESIHRLIRNVDRVYFLIANIENQKVETIVKQTDYKNGIMKFEHKTKCNMNFNEIEKSKPFKNIDTTILQRKLNATYLPVFEAEVAEVYEKEIEMFEDIRDLMKEKYKENKKQQETKATYDKMINTPLFYQLLNYQQMFYAMQQNKNQNNQSGQLPSIFPIPGVMNYPVEVGNNITPNIGYDHNYNNIQSASFPINHMNGTGLFRGNINDENRERYFDLKEIGRYIELEKKMKRDCNDDNCYYLSTLKEDITNSKSNVVASKQEMSNKGSHSDKKKERKLSRSRSKSRSSYNKTSKKVSNNSYTIADEEGFYSKKISNQTSYNSNTISSNHNQSKSKNNTKYQSDVTFTSKQNYSSHSRQQQYYQQSNDKNPQQHQRSHHYQDSYSNSYHDHTKQHSHSKSDSHSHQSSYPPKYSNQSNVSNNHNDLKIIDTSNCKKIIFNRDKKPPEIKITPPNKFSNK